MMLKSMALLLLVVGLVACAPTETTPPTTAPTEDPTPTQETLNQPDDSETVTEEAIETAEAEAVDYNGPDWTQLELVNARTGEPFTIADFAGKTVFVEPMATWCTNCRAQQREVIDAQSQLGDSAVFISLSVENGLADQVLADYAEQNGFDWVFAVATPELANALVEQYGRTILTPPSTPHFLIRPDGTPSDLRTGNHRAEVIVETITAENS